MEPDAIGARSSTSVSARQQQRFPTLLGATVNITTRKVSVLKGTEFEFKNLEPAVGVEIAYVEGLEGSNVMMFSRNLCAHYCRHAYGWKNTIRGI